MTTLEILQQAQLARRPLALAGTDAKDAALEEMAVALVAAKEEILAANRRDLDAARGKTSEVMLDRLALTPTRLTEMAKGMREVAALEAGNFRGVCPILNRATLILIKRRTHAFCGQAVRRGGGMKSG